MTTTHAEPAKTSSKAKKAPIDAASLKDLCESLLPAMEVLEKGIGLNHAQPFRIIVKALAENDDLREKFVEAMGS